ncbi:hypothetical protein [Geopseudomonas aromaticivorans]
MKPNAALHNPAPAYLRDLLKRADVSQREAARLIGLSLPGLQNYLGEHRPAPYTVQFALELLAEGTLIDAEALHNPAPSYLRSLLKRARLSQRAAATLIGMTKAGLQNYLRALHDAKYRPAPYAVQIALEALAAD